ncbi:MAG: peptide/nickel transport system substrate-binding protein [Gaiellaceae bacterium]|jgi:peptide/nickel transport system substrate-binding protein|nr:peptide/nickel transport system substrate-binding protein [Gaiellaceae bacterium]
MRKRRLAAVAIAASVLAVAFGASLTRSSAAKSGGTFRIGTSSRIDSLNPYVAFNQDAYSTFEYIYPFLIQYDAANLRYAPDFAVSWKASKDGKTWTFKTRENAKWSDGKPLTAADAAWTINADIKYKDGGAANAAGLIAHIKGASAPNPTTLVVRYVAAAGNVLGQFQQFAILPKHIWSKYTGHKGADLKTFSNKAPVVGAGPFKLVKFTKDSIALFQRNDSFYGPKPQADGFGLRMFSNDDALVTALKSHEIDAIEDVPGTAIATLQKAGFAVKAVPGVDQTDFIINSNPKKPKNRELLNLKLREAFDHAIDRNRIVRVVFLGKAKPGVSIIPPATGEWHNTGLKPVSFDLSQANKILDGLGYKKGAGGIRKANGHAMSYQVIAPTDVSSVDRTFQIIQSDFRKIGVKLAQKALDSSAAFDAITAPGTKYLNFDLAMWDWVALMDPDFMLSVVTCSQFGGWSDSGFCDKKYDRMYNQQQLTPDQGKRRQVVWDMQTYLYAKRPYLWLAAQDHVSAVSPKWTGLVHSPQGPFNSLSKLSLTQVHQTG